VYTHRHIHAYVSEILRYALDDKMIVHAEELFFLQEEIPKVAEALVE